MTQSVAEQSRTDAATLPGQYSAELVGKSYSVDGGQDNCRGRQGVIGTFPSFEDAIAAARKEANETCMIRITLLGTRARDPLVVYDAE